MKLVIFTDGASRGNPGVASYGFTISDQDGKLVYEEGKYIGITTNNVAEYTAVLEAYRWIKQNIKEKVILQFFADSKLVAEQLSGKWRIKNPNLKILHNEIKLLETEVSSAFYTHIPREKNTIADGLANKALDSRK